MNRKLRTSPLFAALLLCNCSDDAKSPNAVADAGADAAADAAMSSNSSPTASSSGTSTAPSSSVSGPDAGDGGALDAASDASSPGSCAHIAEACHPLEEQGGLAQLCHETGHGGDAEQCAAISDACLALCEDGVGPAPAGDAGAEQCTTIGHACHDYDTGSGLGALCHSVGHSGDPDLCGVVYGACADFCGLHEHPDGGHASDAGDAGSLNVTLQFKAQFEDAPFACGQTYPGQGSSATSVTPSDLRLYVSGVRLITAAGDEVEMQLDERTPFQASQVALLDFEDGTGACSNGNPALNATITGRAPAGDYQGVVFSVSVPEALNHADPTTLPAPLQAGGMTWGWLYGYKFLKAEVLQVQAGDAGVMDAGMGDAGMPMLGAGLFHLGSTGCDNAGPNDAGPDFAAPPTASCSMPNRNEVRLNGYAWTQDSIIVDLAALFADTDLTQMSMCHSLGEGCDALFDKVGLDYATGAQTDTQALFRVE